MLPASSLILPRNPMWWNAQLTNFVAILLDRLRPVCPVDFLGFCFVIRCLSNPFYEMAGHLTPSSILSVVASVVRCRVKPLRRPSDVQGFFAPRRRPALEAQNRLQLVQGSFGMKFSSFFFLQMASSHSSFSYHDSQIMAIYICRIRRKK